MTPRAAVVALFLAASPLLFADDLATNAAPPIAPAPPPPVRATNPAVVPVENNAKDSYNVAQRHAAVLAQKDALHPQIVLIGDSITMHWGGPPDKGPLRPAWVEAFGAIPTLNLGFGYDLTQNVLWRLDHGELDGLRPKTVVILIGTNNMTGNNGSPRCRDTTPAQTVEGILAVVARVKAKSPTSRIMVMAVFPRGEKPDNPYRPKVRAINDRLAEAMKAHPEVTYLDIGAQFLQPDGTLPKKMMKDGTHPAEDGYSVWAKALVAAGVRN